MSTDRNHFDTVNDLPSSISRGATICTFDQLMAGSFTYEGFNFTARSYGGKITSETSIEYAVRPPIILKEGDGGYSYCVDDTDKLILVHHPQTGNQCLRKVSSQDFLILASPSSAGIESGEVIANLTGTQGSKFTWEGYEFTEGQNPPTLTSDPVITNV